MLPVPMKIKRDKNPTAVTSGQIQHQQTVYNHLSAVPEPAPLPCALAREPGIVAPKVDANFSVLFAADVYFAGL